MISKTYSILVALLLVSHQAAALTTAVDVDVTAPDGAILKATYYSPGKPGPAVILLHQCDMNRHSWEDLAAALTGRGIHVLAPDYRGYGDNRALTWNIRHLSGDLDSALTWLLRQPGVDVNRVAAGGASCGLDHAVQLARRSGQLKALLLLSGSTTTDGMAYIQRSNIPVFLAFSADEGGPLPEMKMGVGMSKNNATTIRELNHAGHGVRMFSAEPTLIPAIADWLAKVLL